MPTITYRRGFLKFCAAFSLASVSGFAAPVMVADWL